MRLSQYSNLSATVFDDDDDIESCSYTCAERTSSVVLVSTWARSRAKAVERDVLVVYIQ